MHAACANNDITDPFVLWMDDIFAVQPVDVIPTLHNGPMQDRRGSGRWRSGHRATARWLRQKGYDRPLSFELHVPLVVHKGPMLVALIRSREIPHPQPHKRSVYGNLAKLDGSYSDDVKTTNPRAPFVGPWVSSADATFQTCVLPRLDFPEPSPYET